MMQDWANWAIETAKRRGATYADARVMDIRLSRHFHKERRSRHARRKRIARNRHSRAGRRSLGFCLHGSSHARGRASLRRRSDRDCQSFCRRKARKREARSRTSLRRYVAEPFHQRSVPHSGGTPDRPAARSGQRNAPREGSHGRRRFHDLPANRAAFCFEHRLRDSSGENAIGRRESWPRPSPETKSRSARIRTVLADSTC